VAFIDFASPTNDSSVSKADILPEFGVIDEIALPLSYSAEELVKAGSVVELVEKVDEEVDVTRSVNKVSTRALIFGTPNLDGHCFCEDLLGKFVLCGYCGGAGVFSVIVDDMCGLVLKVRW